MTSLVESLDELVRADGAHFELAQWDDSAAVLRLKLVLDDAACAECVVPRPLLESIALDKARGEGVSRVEIDDPRERP